MYSLKPILYSILASEPILKKILLQLNLQLSNKPYVERIAGGRWAETINIHIEQEDHAIDKRPNETDHQSKRARGTGDG